MELWHQVAGLLTLDDRVPFGRRSGRNTLLLDLHRMLLWYVSGAMLRFGKCVTGRGRTGAGTEVCFDDGGFAGGDALMAADGNRPVIRGYTFPDLKLHYGQTCYRAVSECELDDRLRRVGREVCGGELQLGFCPLQPALVYWYALQRASSSTVR